jgi:hypothetical protein
MAKITWKTRRRIRLLREGFFRFELRRFVGGDSPKKSLCDFPMSRPYMKRMRRERRSLLRAAKKAGWTMSQYERAVKDEYRRMGWARPGRFGRPVADPWAMFRYYYRLSERLGDYTPPPRRRKDKGDVKAQKARYKERQARRQVRDQSGKVVGRVKFNQAERKWGVEYD